MSSSSSDGGLAYGLRHEYNGYLLLPEVSVECDVSRSAQNVPARFAVDGDKKMRLPSDCLFLAAGGVCQFPGSAYSGPTVELRRHDTA